MLNKLVRTTVQIDSVLFKQAKLKAISDGVTFRDLVETGLKAAIRAKKNKISKKKVSFGGYDLGGIKGKFSRKEIYEDI